MTVKKSLVSILKETSCHVEIFIGRKFVARGDLRTWNHARCIRQRYGDAFNDEGILRCDRRGETRHLRRQKNDGILFARLLWPGRRAPNEEGIGKKTHPASEPRKRERLFGPLWDEEFPSQNPYPGITHPRDYSDRVEIIRGDA